MILACIGFVVGLVVGALFVVVFSKNNKRKIEAVRQRLSGIYTDRAPEDVQRTLREVADIVEGN